MGFRSKGLFEGGLGRVVASPDRVISKGVLEPNQPKKSVTSVQTDAERMTSLSGPGQILKLRLLFLERIVHDGYIDMRNH